MTTGPCHGELEESSNHPPGNSSPVKTVGEIDVPQANKAFAVPLLKSIRFRLFLAALRSGTIVVVLVVKAYSVTVPALEY
jgi:hypothetical protein